MSFYGPTRGVLPGPAFVERPHELPTSKNVEPRVCGADHDRGRSPSERQSGAFREMEKRALDEGKRNPRYRWLGALPYGKTRRLLADSHLVALTSRMEGSSNVLSEALISSVPVVASQIPGHIGTLGENYPGYFPLEDTQALTRQLLKAEAEPAFYRELKAHCARVSWLVHPQREQTSWGNFMESIASDQAP